MITQYFDTSITKWRQLFVGLGLLLLVLFALNISLGSVAIPLSSVIDFILLRPPEDNSWHLIMAKFRLPKALTATSHTCWGWTRYLWIANANLISESYGWAIHFRY